MLELDKQIKQEAIASLKHYFEQNMPEHIGDLAAGLLLDYFLEEIGPVIYNKAITDARRHASSNASPTYPANASKTKFNTGRARLQSRSRDR